MATTRLPSSEHVGVTRPGVARRPHMRWPPLNGPRLPGMTLLAAEQRCRSRGVKGRLGQSRIDAEGALDALWRAR